jgi:hypothetical protein
MRRYTLPVVRWSLLLGLSLAARAALAFDSVAGDPILDRFNIDVGTFFYGTGTTITFNGQYGERGTPIDAERTLGLHEADRFRLDAYWRFTKHQRLRVAYFEADRHATKTIDQTLQYGNVTFPVNASVSTQNNASIAELFYEFDFLVLENFSLGVDLGVHNIDFGMKLSATTNVPGMTPSTVTVSQNASADGPLPMIGMSAIWRVSPQFYFTASAQGLKVTVNPYSGSFQDYGGTVVWQPFKHFGIGGGYDLFLLDAGVNKSSFNGHLTWRYSGPRAFISGSF